MRKAPSMPATHSADVKLGRRLSTHVSTREGVKFNVAAGVLVIFVGIVAIIWGINTLPTTGMLCAAVGVVLVPLGMWGIATTVRRKTVQVTVYRDALVYEEGNEKSVIYWEEIASYYCDTLEHFAAQRFSQRSADQVFHYCRIRTVEGHSFVFDDTLSNVRKLATLIDENTVALIAPYVMTAFEAGSAVDFGPLIVSREGLRANNNFCPWHEVVRFDLLRQRGAIVVEQYDNPVRFGTFMIAYIPNLTSLKVITQRMLAEHTNGAVTLRVLAA